MPRKRIIDPEFWSDQEIGFWSFEARLFYIGLWNFADDEGRLKAHPALLKAQIFPYELKVDIEMLKKEVACKVQWYESDSSQYGFIRNFLKHQRIDRPTTSKLPIPRALDESSMIPRGHLAPKLSKEKLSKEKVGQPHFVPPTLEEVSLFCKERNNNVDPQRWHNFYMSKGWMIGKNKMKDWKAAVRNWEEKRGPTEI